MGTTPARRVFASSASFCRSFQSLEHYASDHYRPFQATLRAVPRPRILFRLRRGGTWPSLAQLATLLSELRLSEDDELTGCLDRVSAYGTRHVGAPSPRHGTPDVRRGETRLPLAVSLADSASLHESFLRPHKLYGCVFLRYHPQ